MGKVSKYTDLAMARRSQFSPDGHPAWNCCQAVVTVFAQDAGYDEEAAMKVATYFRGGMQMGSVCGAMTGGLMALGLAGLSDPQISNEYLRKIKENHNGLMNCKDLLRINAENGGDSNSSSPRRKRSLSPLSNPNARYNAALSLTILKE